MTRWTPIFARAFCSVALLAASASLADAQATPAKSAPIKVELPPPPKPLLPDAFAGWVAAEPPKNVIDPALADNANVSALKEYGFTHAVLANYKRDGETLTVHALSFLDTSGAYGAYTFYRQNGWPKEEIGTGATSNKNRVLFWVGTTVVDATFSNIGPMSAAELRELAKQLPSRAREQSHRPADSRRSAAGFARQTNHTLCLRPRGLCRCGRCSASRSRWLRSRRGSRDSELLAPLESRHAHHHRLPHAPDGRRAGNENSRLH